MPSLRRGAGTSRRVQRPETWKLAVAALAVLALAACSWLLLRNSSLVQVEQVRVVGLGGHYDEPAREALTDELKRMTTMNIDESSLRSVLANYVDINDLRVETDFPHGATVYVDVRRAVVLAKINGRSVALTAEGEIIEGARGLSLLPRIEVGGTINAGRVTDGKAVGAARVLGTAPDVFLRKVDSVEWGGRGLTITLDKGLVLYFGGSDDARQKWRDVSAVLASGKADGATYLDLRAPGRPSIGGLGASPTTQNPAALDALPEESSATTAAPATTTAPQQADPQTTTPAPTVAPQTTTPAPQQSAPTVGGASPAN
jgi:hypothetical protein